MHYSFSYELNRKLIYTQSTEGFLRELANTEKRKIREVVIYAAPQAENFQTSNTICCGVLGKIKAFLRFFNNFVFFNDF